MVVFEVALSMAAQLRLLPHSDRRTADATTRPIARHVTPYDVAAVHAL